MYKDPTEELFLCKEYECSPGGGKDGLYSINKKSKGVKPTPAPPLIILMKEEEDCG